MFRSCSRTMHPGNSVRATETLLSCDPLSTIMTCNPRDPQVDRMLRKQSRKYPSSFKLTMTMEISGVELFFMRALFHDEIGPLGPIESSVVERIDDQLNDDVLT